MRHLFTFKAALLAASALALPAHAQEEDIIVTGTRTPAPASQLPAAVTVIDIDRARERGEITLDQALAQAPGIQAPRTGPIGQQTSIFSGGFESNHTLVLFDGVRLDDASTPEGVFDAGQDLLGDAARIEVVQGPMSALYGSGALGGVVNVLPRRGGDGAFNPRFEAAAGSFDTLTATLGADGTLGAFRYAVTAEGYGSEGYDTVPERISTHNGEKDGADIATFTGVFDWALSETLSLDLLLRQRDATVEYDPGIFGNIDENLFTEIASESALWRVGATWAPSAALTLRVRGGGLDTDRETSDAGVLGDVYYGERRFADASADWRLGDWTLSVGGQAEEEKINAVSYGSPIVGAQEQWGAFAGVQGAVGALSLTGVVRHDDYEGFGGETTWRAGAAYDIAGLVRVYGAYGTSFRAPSLYERFVPFFGAAGLRPESATSWEAGADASFALFGQENGLELGALYRSSEIEDLIGFFGFTYANVDEAEIEYAEARATLRPLPWLSASVRYGNTDARDASTDVALARRPRHAWSAEIGVEHGPFAAQLDWREVGSRLDTTYDNAGFWAGTGRVEAYNILRLSASWAVSDSVRLYAAGDNVLDETYEAVNGFAGAPASIMVGVRIAP
ncbi:MAG TPA: TonB-dependent receptor [Terricaulis sp.]|nr:TonB-dependent receptor [Terricaulis sp.]